MDAQTLAEMQQRFETQANQISSMEAKMEQLIALMTKNAGSSSPNQGGGQENIIPKSHVNREKEAGNGEEEEGEEEEEEGEGGVPTLNSVALIAALKAKHGKDLIKMIVDEEPPMDVESRIANEVNKAMEKMNQKLEAISAIKDKASGELQLFTFPKVEVPPKFKIPKFERYDGSGNPDFHVKGYCASMSIYSTDPTFLLAHFHRSLKGAAYNWLMKQDNGTVRSWDLMVRAFREHFKHNIRTELTRESMLAFRRKTDESFREYASRWREASLEVQPPMNQREVCRYFVKSLQDPAYDMLSLFPYHDFAELITAGEEIDLKPKEVAGGRKNYYGGGKKKEDGVHYVQNNAGDLTINTVGEQSSQQGNRYKGNNNNSNNNRRNDRELPNMGLSRADLFHYLKEKHLISPTPGKKWEAPYPPWYKPELSCLYHQGSQGHSIDTCDQFKRQVLKMIDVGWLNLPNITKNPMPEHRVNAVSEDVTSIRKVSDSSFSLEKIYEALMTGGYVASSSQEGQNFCLFHQEKGHGTNECQQWASEAQRFVDLGILTMGKRGKRQPVCVVVREEDLPFTINLPPIPTNVPIQRQAEEFTSKVTIYAPGPIPFTSNKAVPWIYGPMGEETGKLVDIKTSANISQQRGMTRSGRVFGRNFVGEQGESSKTEEEKEEDEFLALVKTSEYDVVEQMRKTPSKISILSLLLNSEIHRKALLKALAKVHVSADVTPEKAVNLLDVTKHMASLSFTNEEIFPGTKALHITVKCFGFIIAKVLVDGGSALNVLPAATSRQLPIEPSQISNTNMVVRAFDGTRREATGSVTLPVEIGPCTFDIQFQLMEVEAAYTMLLGRPWIHQAQAVPSTLHQKIKFVKDGRIITIKGEESMLISNPSPVPYIDNADESLETAFQGLELQDKMGFQINHVAVKIMKELGYKKGQGLGPTLSGIPKCILPYSGDPRVGIGYEGVYFRRKTDMKNVPHITKTFIPAGTMIGEDFIAVTGVEESAYEDNFIWRSTEEISLDNWEAEWVYPLYDDK